MISVLALRTVAKPTTSCAEQIARKTYHSQPTVFEQLANLLLLLGRYLCHTVALMAVRSHVSGRKRHFEQIFNVTVIWEWDRYYFCRMICAFVESDAVPQPLGILPIPLSAWRSSVHSYNTLPQTCCYSHLYGCFSTDLSPVILILILASNRRRSFLIWFLTVSRHLFQKLIRPNPHTCWN